MKKLKRDWIIRITWVDQSWYHGPVPAEGSINKIAGFTVGYFLEEDKDWISLAMEYFKGQDDPITYRHIVTIPKCAISQIEILFKTLS